MPPVPLSQTYRQDSRPVVGLIGSEIISRPSLPLNPAYKIIITVLYPGHINYLSRRCNSTHKLSALIWVSQSWPVW
jgi:hypothetical protein